MLATFKKTCFAVFALSLLAAPSYAQRFETAPSVVPPQSPSQQTVPQQRFVQPGQERLLLPPQGQIQPQNPYFFGFNVVLVRDWRQTRLRIISVTPGSPAQLAGLEIGDEIALVNGRGFRFAQDSFDAVRLLNQYVIDSFQPIAPAAAIASPGCRTRLLPPLPRPQSMARMLVRNVRNGQMVSVKVFPERVVPIDVAPAAAAQVAAGG